MNADSINHLQTSFMAAVAAVTVPEESKVDDRPFNLNQHKILSSTSSSLNHDHENSDPSTSTQTITNEKNLNLDLDLEAAAHSRPHTVHSTTTTTTNHESPHTSRIQHLEKETFDDFPEGGWEAWGVVFGAWCAMTASMGISNSMGFLQAWISTHQLAHHTEAEVSWIFSIFSFLLFFGGVQVGPIFDSYGVKWLLIPGCAGLVASMCILSVCEQYYQFMLGFAVLGGISCTLVFTPSVTIVGHWFYKRRGLATGICATGGAVGGVVFPLVLVRIMPRIGFGWSIRVIALIDLILCIAAVCLMKTRLPLVKSQKGALIDLRAFLDLRFTLTTIGVFLIEWALFVPLTYITAYALAHGVETTFAYQLLAILNAGSVIGRGVPGYLADQFGRFNVMIVTATVCALTCLVIWLPAENHLAPIILFALMFGFWSGTGICLTPVCISQICKTEDYGKRYGTCYFFVSFGVLTGIPIAGQIMEQQNGSYTGLICFSAASYLAGSMFFVAARVLSTGWKLNVIY